MGFDVSLTAEQANARTPSRVQCLMMDGTTLFAFVVASAAIIVAPGPAQTLVLARTVSGGRRAGVLTAVGLNVGTIVHAVAAALGLSAVLARSAILFGVVKYAGALYLVVLGIQALRSSGGDANEHAELPPGTGDGAFRKAVITGVLNPKVALFFLAFLPQFVDPHRGSAFLQFLVLGTVLATLDTLYESGLATLAGSVRNAFVRGSRFGRWQQRTTGTVLIGLGFRLALAHRNA